MTNNSTDTYASPAAIAMTPEELLETMTGMFLPPSAMGEVNGLKVLCLQRENTALKAEVERLREQLQQVVDIAEWYMDNLIDSPRKVALDEIKATMNPTDK